MFRKIVDVVTTAVGINHEESKASVTTQQRLQTNVPELPLQQVEYLQSASVPITTATISASMKRVATPYNKYESLVSMETIRGDEDDQLMLSSWSDLIFGKEQTEFQAMKDRFFARREMEMEQEPGRRRHKLGQQGSTIPSQLSTIDGTMWKGTIYMGSQKQPMDVIFDTASDWLSIEGEQCTTCEGDVYQMSESSEATQIGDIYGQRIYGSTTLSGIEWTDQVCVIEAVCISDFEFFLISAQDGLKEPIDGILGLARNAPFYLSRSKTAKRGPSYMAALKNADVITQKTFSFAMAPEGTDSFIDFGEVQDSRMKDPDSLVYIDLLDDFFWSAKCQGFAIGSIKNGYKWGSIDGAARTINKGEMYSIFDTGASAILLPEAYFKSYLKQLYKGMGQREYEVNSGYVLSKCYNDFPSLYFMFDNQWLSIEPNEYVVDISADKDRSLCILLLSQGKSDLAVMGLPIFMDYYAVHDEEAGRLGFAPRFDSTKQNLVKGKQPSKTFMSDNPKKEEISPWSWVISSMIFLAFIILWVFAISAAFINSESKKQPGVLCIVAILFIIAFGVIVYFLLQPLINKLFVVDPDAAKAAYTAHEMVGDSLGDNYQGGAESGGDLGTLVLLACFSYLAYVLCSSNTSSGRDSSSSEIPTKTVE